MLPLYSKGTKLVVITRTPTYNDLQTCPHVTCSSAHEWDPQNFCFPKISHIVEEDIPSYIGAVMTEVVSPDLTDTDSGINSLYQVYDIVAMTSRIIGSVKFALFPSSNVS